MALPAGVTPNYIFPFIPNADANAYNQQGFEELMFRPLYYIGGNNDSVAINCPLSTADAPVYTGGGKTVTITMKGWKWSDGETVDAADLIFWLNMMKAERANFYGCVPGLIPDDLASYGATGPETVVLHPVDNGYGYPTSGAVPQEPTSEWIPTIQGENGGQGPYPYSIATATAVLTSHGWSKVSGVMTCESPAKCGGGMAKGTRLSFTIDYPTGITAFQGEVADYQSDAGKAGIKISLVPQAFDTVVGESAPCAVGPRCSWDMLYLGGWSFDGDAGGLRRSGGDQQAGERRVQRARRLHARVLAFHQVAGTASTRPRASIGSAPWVNGCRYGWLWWYMWT